MVETGLKITADTSGAVSGMKQMTAATKEFAQSEKEAQSQSAAFSDYQSSRNSQRSMPGFNRGNGANGETSEYRNLGANDSLKAYNDLSLRIQELTTQIVKLSDIQKDAVEKGDTKTVLETSSAINQAEQQRARLEMQKKKEEAGSKNSDDDDTDAIRKLGIARYFTQGLNYANQIAGIGFNRRIAVANGDYLGADVSAAESGANVAQGIGGAAMGAGMTVGATPVGWGLMAAGGILELGGAIAKYFSGNERANIAEGEAYRKTLAGTNALNKRFDNAGEDWLGNSRQTNQILRQSTELAAGTGLSRDDFLNLAVQQSRFGAGSREEAMRQARSVALWANATGTDAGVIQNFLGTARRYGDTSDVLGYASQARQAAGLTKAQNEEFLNSLQGVIEDGIANGYVKSTEDVSKTLVMFTRLTNGNPLWQGEQGARRLQQMNSGISGATALQSVSDVIVANAAKNVLDNPNIDTDRYFDIKDKNGKTVGNRRTGTYVDEMLLMEQGNNPALFGEIAKMVQDAEGGNAAAQIERFKDIFKMNYTGAVDVYNMAQKYLNGDMDESTFANQIAKMQKDSSFRSEETKWQDAVNRLDTNVALMAQSKFWESLKTLEGKAGIGGLPAATTQDHVQQAAESVGLSSEKTADLQTGMAEANGKMGFDKARANGDAELAAEVETTVMGAQVSDMGEYGKAANLLWKDMYREEGGSIAGVLGLKENPELENRVMDWIGQAATTKKGDFDVSRYEVAAVYDQLKNPTGGLFGSQKKQAKQEIEDFKTAYTNGDVNAMAEAFEKGMRRALNNSKINFSEE